MVKYFEKCTTRMNKNLATVKAWAKGQEKVGLVDHIFICQNGKVVEYLDSEQGEEFHNRVKGMTEEDFDNVCTGFFQALEEKNLENMYPGLVVFDELDNFPELGTKEMRIRLGRIRESTHEKSYQLEIKDPIKDFILHCGSTYLLEDSRGKK